MEGERDLLHRLGPTALAMVVVIWVLLDGLAKFGVIQTAPIATQPSYQDHDLVISGLDQLDDLHRWHNRRRSDGTFMWDLPVGQADALKTLVVEMRSQTAAMNQLVYELRADREARNTQ